MRFWGRDWETSDLRGKTQVRPILESALLELTRKKLAKAESFEGPSVTGSLKSSIQLSYHY